MNCSKCGETFLSAVYKGYNFKYCKSCGSVLVDKETLEKLTKAILYKEKTPDLFNQQAIIINEEKCICPQCSDNMEKVELYGVLLDICKHCNIIHFENSELSKYFNQFDSNIEICDNINFIKKYFNESKKEEEEEMYKKTEIINYDAGYKDTDAFAIPALPLVIVYLLILLITLFVLYISYASNNTGLTIFLSTITAIIVIGGSFLSGGLKMISPQEAVVLTTFGKYTGTLRQEGFYLTNPFSRPFFSTEGTRIS